MSMRALFLFGLLCPLVALSALSPSGATPAPGARAGDFPQLVGLGRCELIKEDEVIILKGPDGDRARVITAKEHKPPFALRVTAKTDSRNLRLYYDDGMVIFNWE